MIIIFQKQKDPNDAPIRNGMNVILLRPNEIKKQKD